MEPTYVTAERAPAPVGPYSHACGVPNGLLFLSGQTPIDPKTGQLVNGGIEEQTARVFDNLGLVLEAAGSSWRDVLKVNVFLVDMDDFAAMNAVYARYFDGHFDTLTPEIARSVPRLPSLRPCPRTNCMLRPRNCRPRTNWSRNDAARC